ncbi:MAG: SpoIIE family protein phosphatase [Spirochaetaceae bacterium]|nr:SpoIIE family protein phosphatase [Spirochaetaceae bacterium]
MKIRPQLILVETVLSAALFLSVLFSITSFVRFITFEDLKIKTAALQDTAGRMKYESVGMLTKSDPTSFITLEFQLLMDQMNTDLEDISNDVLFDQLSEEVKLLFDEVKESWIETQSFMSIDQMSDYLDLRNDAPFDTQESLTTIQALLVETGEGDATYLNAIDTAIDEIQRLDQRHLSVYEALLDRTLTKMLEAAESYRRLQLIMAISVPGLMLLLALAGILFYSNNLSRKLRRLDTALSNVAGGDFSIRVEMKGKDEFSSLATSINAFTRTLGAKLESFRLIMHEIGQNLASNIESSQVEETILRLAMKESAADGAALYKVSGDSGELMLSVVEGRFRPPFTVEDLPEFPEDDDIEALLRSRIIRPGVTIIGKTANQGESQIIRNVQFTNSIDWTRVEGDPLFISSIITVPLRIGSTVFGVLAITSSKSGQLFTDLDYANIQSFAELASITLDNIYKYADLLEATQLNRELGIAEEIQQDLLPKQLPRLPSGEVAYLSRSIKGLNGDYFDVFPLGGGKTMVTICEVAGRGVPAGLVMVMIRTILRLVAPTEFDAQSIMTRLNSDMTQRIAIENYASVGILVLDSDGNFTFSSAAHYPLQILRADSAVYQAIQTEGIPVGIDAEAEYTQQTGVLSPGDILVFHTDGIPESRNRDGKLFGIDSLLEAVSNQAKGSPEQIIETLRTELEYFERGTDQKDDQTVIVLKFTGSNAA